LVNLATTLCKPAVGIEVFRDDWAYTIPCGRNDCNSPETTIFHNDHTATSKNFPGSISFGYKETRQAQVYEWDFFGKYPDDPGLGFHAYRTRCPTLPSNQGVGCLERALEIERGYLPRTTWAKFKCGTTW
ncbi:hypothetical protein B0T25DRAFT_462170, partial [Lasiosphaeria hispida]